MNLKTIPWGRWLLSSFLIISGFNHFLNPDFYYPLIPDYLPFHQLINIVSGIVEIVFGAGFFWQITRSYTSYLTIAMLIAFIPSHVYFITLDGCVGDSPCIPMWIAWGRLVVIHPLLIFWVWKCRE